MKILAFSASNSSKSINAKLVQYAQSILEAKHEVEIIDMATSDNEAGGVSMQSRYVTIATEAIEGWSAGDLPYLSSDHTANEGIQTANWKRSGITESARTGNL